MKSESIKKPLYSFSPPHTTLNVELVCNKKVVCVMWIPLHFPGSSRAESRKKRKKKEEASNHLHTHDKGCT